MLGVVSPNALPDRLAEAVLAVLPDSMVVLDRRGTIMAVNEAWKRFARDNGAPDLADNSIGVNYLAICREARSALSGEGAQDAYAGLRAVLDGAQPSFAFEYPCHSPTEQRWFLLRATPLLGEHGGAMVQHIDITERKRLEQELAEQRHMFDGLLTACPDHIFLLDPAGRFTYVNPAAAAAIAAANGRPPDEIIGHTARELGLPPDFIRQFEQQLALACAGQAVVAETAFPDPRGLRRFEYVLSPIYAEDGRLEALAGVTRDIEERTRLRDEGETARREASQQAQQLEAVFAAIQDGVIVFDWDGYVIRANAVDRALLGEEVAMPLPRERVQERVRRLGIQDAEGAALPPERIPAARVLHGETLSGEQAADVCVRTADGRPVEISVTGAPTLDDQGQPTGGVLVYRDVTERRRLERSTAAALDALLALAALLVAPERRGRKKQAPAGADVLTQRMAKLTRVVFGCECVSVMRLEPGAEHLRPIALAGRCLDDVQRWYTEEARPLVADFLPATALDALRSGEVVMDDCTTAREQRPRPGGASQVLIAPLQVGTRLLGAIRLDYGEQLHAYTRQELALAQGVGQLVALVLEHEQLEREYAEAHAHELAAVEVSRNLDQFFAVAAHDIRSPITAALAHAELAHVRCEKLASLEQARGGEEVELAARVRTSVKATKDSLDRLVRMTGRLFDVAQARAGKLEVRLAPCELATLVREQVEEQRIAMPECVIRLEVPARASAPVAADAERISQVLANYLTNALKYSPPDRPVDVSLQMSEGRARVAVRDVGPGLPPDEQVRVWDPFHRAVGVEVQAGARQSLGLGLHICKMIVERHSGQVGVESAVGVGSTFWFTLPLAPEAAASSPRPPPHRSRPRSEGGGP